MRFLFPLCMLHIQSILSPVTVILLYSSISSKYASQHFVLKEWSSTLLPRVQCYKVYIQNDTSSRLTTEYKCIK